MTGPLAPYRVLDLTTDRAWMTGKILADLGAEVIKIEPPGGDPGRRTGAFAHDSGSPNDHLGWWFENRGKRSVVLDLESSRGSGRLLELVDGADVLLESFAPRWLEAHDLAPASLIDRNPRLVITSITPFGRTGPHAAHLGPDLVLAARCGLAYLTGDEDRPPVRISSPQIERHGAAEAAVHTLIALYHATATGHGQHVDVSAQLAGVRTLMNATGFPPLEGFDVVRRGPGMAYSQARFQLIYPCADGHVTLLPVAGAMGAEMMRFLTEWAAREGVAIAEAFREVDWTTVDYAEIASRQDANRFFDQISHVFSDLFKRYTKQELYAEALEHGLLLAPLNTVADLPNDAQLQARGYFTGVDHDGASVTYAGAWARLSRTPLVHTTRAPRIGEHGDAVIAEPAREPAPMLGREPEPPQVFAGLKVWDMSWVGVGPMTGRYLGDHGATVVRLDSTVRPDVLRVTPPFRDGEPGINRSQFYADMNSSKLGIGIDLSKPAGRELARELAVWADVVLESFTPRNVRGWGLDYASLRALNPSLVMLSTCMQGQTGPRANYRGFGNVMAAMAGFYTIAGWPDRGPVCVYGAYTDFISQRFCAAALIAALDHRQRTGEGQFIDVAQYEAALQFLGPELLDHQVNDRVASRKGNRHPQHAPHGIFPCRGTEEWIAIAVETDAQWRVLCQAMGDPDWTRNVQLQSAAGRKKDESALERHVARWTSLHTASDLVERLQPAVPAGAVATQSALYTDPQIAHRGYFVELEHAVMGSVPYNGLQARLSRTPGRLTKAAPCVGEDSYTVLAEILGKSDDAIADLIAAEVVEIT